MSEITLEPLRLVVDFEDFLRSAYGIDHILFSEEYRERRDANLRAFPVVLEISEPFLRSTKDIEAANNISIPDYGKAICFPYRFLGKPSTSSLPTQEGAQLSNTLDDIFFAGLNFHFFWATFPTRKEYKNINTEALMGKWLLDALVADKIMGKFYRGEGGQMANNLFDIRYSSTCEPFLKKDIRVGFFKRGMCKAFFRNIYWAGALLGVQYDMATK